MIMGRIMVMEQDNDLMTLPLVDDPAVKDVFAEFCTGLNFVHGNLHMTFASAPQITAHPKRHRNGSSQPALLCR
jgi:hypothetical protein